MTRQRGYRRQGQGPRVQTLLLLLICLAFAISLTVWRTSGTPGATPTPSVAVPATNTARVPGSLTAIATGVPASRTPVPRTPTPRPISALARKMGPDLDALIAEYTAQGLTRIGIEIEDDRSGDTVERSADDTFAAASLYKLFVLWRTQIEIRQGRLADDSELKLTAANDDAAEDGYAIGTYGDAVSVADLRRLMIAASNNTAAQVLAQWFGLGTIDQMLRKNGFIATTVVGPPITTPREVTRFFAGVLHHDLDPTLQPEDYDLMLELLKEQQVNFKLSTGFPDGTIFAHKTGDITGAHHDAGIVYLPDGRAVCITAMTAGDYDVSLQFQHDLAALVWKTLVT